MSIAFVEYQILPNYWPDYSNWITEVRATYPELDLLEGTDQPGLFVEIWNDVSYEDYALLKNARRNPENGQIVSQTEPLPSGNKYHKTDWEPLAQWVKGGSEKIHIWHFKKVK